jgi:hypothetical protein
MPISQATSNNDTLIGTAGNDTIDGLSGIDTAQIASPSSGVIFSRDAQGRWVVTSGQGVDALVSIEQVDLSGELITLGRNELRVNTTSQQQPSVTALSDGGYVVTWSFRDIYQQRYTAAGAPSGVETRVNTTTASNQWYPTSVTTLNDGGWLVSWPSYQLETNGIVSYWGFDIYQQRYDINGDPVEGETRVNSTTTNDQYFPTVTALYDGGWLVSWMSSSQDGSGDGIYQQRYTAAGVASGAETRVNTTTASSQWSPSVTALHDGGWLVSWTSFGQDGSGWGVYQQRYNADDSTTGWSETRVNTTTASSQWSPSVTALHDGGWLVSWTSLGQDGSGWGIYQQRYTAAGAPSGVETRVNTTTADDQNDPSVTALSDGGWLVSWSSLGQDGSGWGIYQQRYTAAGAPSGVETRVNTYVDGYQWESSVTALADGGWLVSWVSFGQYGREDGFLSYDIFRQRFDASGAAVGSGNVLTGDAAANTLVFRGSEAIELTGMGGDDTLQGGSGNDVLYGGSGNDVVQVGDAQAGLIWVLDADGSLRLSGAGSGSDLLLSVEQVQAADGSVGVGNIVETLVNTTTAGFKSESAIAGLSDGGYVVTWASYGQDGSGGGIYQQHYTAAGTATGGETRVNTTTAHSQYTPSVTGLSDGGWLVSWTSEGQDGSGTGVYAQRFSSTGALVGGEVLVNTTTANNEAWPAIAALTDGGYVVTWTSYVQNASGAVVYAQRYSSTGDLVGGEVLVNSASFNQYGPPAIVALSDGGWLVSWMDGGSGVYAQRFSGTGSLVGGETQVNTTQTAFSGWTEPSVTATALSDGGYVVAWVSDEEIFAQRFSSDGSMVGGETRVITTNPGSGQDYPAMTALSDGGYVVTWMTHGQNYQGVGIFAQRFNSAGSLVGGETQVSSTTENGPFYPAITSLSDGGYVVTWTSSIENGSVLARRFDADGFGEGSFELTGDSSNNVLRVSVLRPNAGVELIGGAGADTLAGGAFDDRLSGESGADTFEFAPSGNGVDRITDWGAGDRIVVVGAAFAGGVTDGDGSAVAHHAVHVEHNSTQTVLHIGTDTIPGADVVIRLDGDWLTSNFVANGDEISYDVDVPAVPDSTVVRNGSAGNDTLQGTPARDVLNALEGDDIVFASAGNDILNGGLGNDTLDGGMGNDVLNAGDGDDVVFAGDGNDVLNGGAGNDALDAGAGNDVVNAGAGVDTVILPMFPNVYSLSENPVGHVVGSYGTSTRYSLVLNDVEWAQFGNTCQTTISLGTLVSGEAQLQLGRLTDLYLAFFGRAPDVGGLEYWQERLLEEGRDFATISKDFAWSDEAQALYPVGGSNREFVRTVYLNCFAREPDAGGWDYWTGRLDGLGVTDLNDRGAFVGEVILGAYATSSGPEDRALLTHRHEAAMYYANKLAVAPAEGFDAAINTLLTRVTGDAATEDKAEDVIDYAFANPVTLTGIMTDQALLDSIWGG